MHKTRASLPTGLAAESDREGRVAAGPCGLCGGVSVRHSDVPSLSVCRSCGIVFLAKFPGKEEREAGYQEEYYREGTGRRFLSVLEPAVVGFRRLRMRSILGRLRGPGAILDVGCGRGALLELFMERGWRVLGTQLSRTAAEAARRTRGVDVVVGELPRIDLQGNSFDVVTFYHVLEHLDRPDLYLRRAWELMADGGLLVVEVPNFASPGFSILGVRNFCFDHPNHLFFFTPASLSGLLERCGFAVEDVSHFSLEYSPYTTLQNLLNVLPGKPSRLYRALMGNDEGKVLRRSPLTWLHGILAVALALPALIFSMAGLFLPVGNTVRFYCRKRSGDGRPEMP